MTRYRRRPLEPGESAATWVTSIALGAGVAAVAFYVTRLLLAREPLGPAAPDGIAGGDAGREGRVLPAGGRAGES